VPPVDPRDSRLPGVRLPPRGRPVQTSGYTRWNHLNRNVQTLGKARDRQEQLTGKRCPVSFDRDSGSCCVGTHAGSSKPSIVRRRRGRAMTYSSWGIAGRPCSRRSCKCLRYRLGPSSEGLRERAFSYQSDNDPDFLRSANPAGKRSRICGGICAWRPSYGGRTHIPREENRRTERTTWVSALRPTDAKCNGVMAAREIDAISRVERGVARPSCCRGFADPRSLGSQP
jgi:hypothetical protein